MSAAGRFDWIRRMGEHEAYHLGPANRLLHWLCIPVELWGVLKLLSVVPLGRVGGVPLDLGLLAIALLAPVYVLTEPLIGAAMVALLLGLHALAAATSVGPAGDALLGGLAFAAAFLVQTKLGHGRFEAGARDDTDRNLREFRRTRNPIPLVLVFYYHLVELFLAAGYRPGLRAQVLGYRDRHLAETVPAGVSD